jgi:UDP-GlcNAc:undecaprenyl-phosphate/decaprenyl-phosphate GlcNAc-1-phosphate transferase
VREYAAVLLTAALVTFLTTPVVRMVAIRLRMMAAPRERDVHVIPTPRGGGVAMYLGVVAAVLVATRLPTLQSTFDDSSVYAVLVAGGLICLLGVLDDKWSLDALTKLTGQIAAAGVMVLLGVQLAILYLPVQNLGTVTFGASTGVPLTILITLLTINALNFIDGLDGLAAGVSAIAALAFFAYAYNLGLVGYENVASAPAIITAVLAGACLGFLPHNFSPARIFMGDSGSMLVGLMLSAAAVTATGQVDPQTFDSAATLLPLTLPLLVPIAVLFIPFVDLVMAVIRRTRRGQSPFSPDKMHLHHRLLAIGHSHRRAVLVMYFWAALLSFGAVALSITGGTAELVVGIGVLLVIGVVAVLSPRARRAAREARAAELAAQRRRSRAAHPTARTPRPPDPGSDDGASLTDGGVTDGGVTDGGVADGVPAADGAPVHGAVPPGARQVAR